MSFMDAKRSGPQEMRSYQEEGPLDKETHDLDRNVFQVQNQVMRFKKVVDQLGTPQDTTDFRARLSSLKNGVQKQAKDVKDRLFLLDQQKDALSQRQQTRVQLAAQNFASVLKDFQAALKLCVEREAVAPVEPAVASSAGGGDTEADMEREALLKHQQQQEVAQLDNLATHNEAIIEERDQEISNLVRDIGEINEMFQDVAVLVHDQGQMIDDIEMNITRTNDRVEDGRQELVKAQSHQKSATSKMLWLALIVLVVVVVVVVAVVGI